MESTVWRNRKTAQARAGREAGGGRPKLRGHVGTCVGCKQPKKRKKNLLGKERNSVFVYFRYMSCLHHKRVMFNGHGLKKTTNQTNTTTKQALRIAAFVPVWDREGTEG